MKHLLTAIACCLAVAGSAQTEWPWNPDEDNNGLIASPDLLEFLAVYGQPFSPEPLIIDSMNLLELVQNLQFTINQLSAQVDSLSNCELGVYSIKLAYEQGCLTEDPVLEATGPNGENLLDDSNWEFIRESCSNFKILHPIQKFGNNFEVHTMLINSQGESSFVTKAISGQSQTLNSVVQFPSKDTIQLNALNNQVGISTNTEYIYITWDFAYNDFFSE